MSFIKSIFKLDADATVVEKSITVLAALIAAVGLIILFGSCLQIFHNDISRAASTATGFSHVIGGILLLLSIVWAWANWSDKVPFRISDTAAVIVLVLLLVFSVLFFTGFYHSSF